MKKLNEKNRKLTEAKNSKKDEFYTQLEDIEQELKHYKKHFELNEMEADHIDPWSKGGPTTSGNCQLLCKEDNRRKSSI